MTLYPNVRKLSQLLLSNQLNRLTLDYMLVRWMMSPPDVQLTNQVIHLRHLRQLNPSDYPTNHLNHAVITNSVVKKCPSKKLFNIFIVKLQPVIIDHRYQVVTSCVTEELKLTQ